MNWSLLRFIITFLSHFQFTHSQTTNTIDDFTHSETLGWVKPPITRGSTSIIYSCLSTLFICLYATFHDDVLLPPSSSSGRGSSGGSGKWGRFLRKTEWILIGIFAPEIMVIHAGLQFFEARRTITQMKEAGVMNWTLTHGFFVNMGGMVLVQKASSSPTVTPTTTTSGLLLKIPVNGDQLAEVFRVKPSAEWWTKISREAITDKSKADTLAKLLALVQASWLVTQIIGRAVSNLSISPLEIESAAYVPLTLVVHLLWWRKPLNVEVPIEIPIEGVHLPDILGIDDPSTDSEKQSSSTPNTNTTNNNNNNTEWKNVIMYISGRTFGSTASTISVMTLGLLFGGIHCFAWNSRFPTQIETNLWRTSSIFTILGGFFAHPIITMISRTIRSKPFPQRNPNFAGVVLRIWDFSGYPLGLVYLLARCFLIFESFYSLRQLPGDTFRMVQWAQYVPHL